MPANETAKAKARTVRRRFGCPGSGASFLPSPMLRCLLQLERAVAAEARYGTPGTTHPAILVFSPTIDSFRRCHPQAALSYVPSYPFPEACHYGSSNKQSSRSNAFGQSGITPE